MKKSWWLILIVFLSLPIVQAIPAAPYFIITEDNSWVPVMIDENGTPVKTLFKKDEAKFNIPDAELGLMVFEQKGDHDYAEVYELQSQCPTVFKKELTGKRRPYFGRLTSEGYFEPDTNFPVRKDFQREDLEKDGIICGYENIQQLRPFRPPAPKRQLFEMFNQERLVSNAEYGYGIKTTDQGTSYYNPSLQKLQEEGAIPPPSKTDPKPIIIFTGKATYEIVYEEKELSILVIPVQFSDVKAKTSLEDLQQTYFGDETSLTKYFKEQSYAALQLSGTVLPQWYTLQESMGYYGDDYETNIEQMIQESILAADPDVDFSEYDSNNDGIVDSLFIVHAGEPDENGGGNNEEIWSHYFSINPMTVDGVQIIDYETVSEESPLGIVAHEFGHYLGLPDLYDTVIDDGESKGIAEWSIMGYGGYLETPGSFDPWSKVFLSWLNDNVYQEITTNDYYTLEQDTASSGLRYYGLPFSDTELFLLENRHKAELMNGDETGGILIWHIDEQVISEEGYWNGCSATRWDCNAVNGNAEHKLIDVEEANGDNDIDKGKLAESTDPWFYACSHFGGCRQTIFSKDSVPASTSYDGSKEIFLEVYSEIGQTMQLGISTNSTSLTPPVTEQRLEQNESKQQAQEETEETSEAPEEDSNFLLIFTITISSILLTGAFFVAWKLHQKEKELQTQNL